MRKMSFGLELPAQLYQLSALLLLHLPALAEPCVQPGPALLAWPQHLAASFSCTNSLL